MKKAVNEQILTLKLNSRAALTTVSKSRDSDFFSNNRPSDIFSPSHIAEDEFSISHFVSQSLSDLTEKIGEIKESQIESQVTSFFLNHS